MPVNFDPKKDAANLRKHGVSLAEGDGVLNDAFALTIEDATAKGRTTLGNDRNECARVINGCRSHAQWG